jgi:hypothetical protein
MELIGGEKGFACCPQDLQIDVLHKQNNNWLLVKKTNSPHSR